MQHIEEVPDVNNDQGALGLDQANNDIPGGQPHVEDNMLGPAPPGLPMQPNQGDVALENVAEPVMAGLAMPGDFFAGPEGEAVENQLDVDMEGWAEGNEDEMMWTNFGLL